MSLYIEKWEIVRVLKILQESREDINIELKLENFSECIEDESDKKRRRFDKDISESILNLIKLNKT